MDHRLEVLDVPLPAHDQPTGVVQPGKEAFDHPPPLIPTERSAILRGRPHAVGFVRRDEIEGVRALQLRVERVGVVRLVADQPWGIRLEEPVFEGRSDEPNFSW